MPWASARVVRDAAFRMPIATAGSAVATTAAAAGAMLLRTNGTRATVPQRRRRAGGDRVNGAHETAPDAERSGLREGDARRGRRGHAPAGQR